MFASLRSSLTRMATTRAFAVPPVPSAVRLYSAHKVETDDEFDNRWVNYFKK